MYAIVADFVLKPSNYMHEPGSWRALNFEHHHLVTWRAFHPTKWSAHYYGQVRRAYKICHYMRVGLGAPGLLCTIHGMTCDAGNKRPMKESQLLPLHSM